MDETSDDLPMSNEGLATQSRLLRDLNSTASTFGKSLTKAFSSGIVEGKRFEDILRSVGQRLSDTLLKAAFKPLESGVSNLLNQGFASLGGLLGGSAQSLGQSLGSVQAFADGGIVGQPTYFGMGRSLGLMGEAGAEAILPLARGSDGKLGVSAGGGGSQPVNVTLNISTPDATSFRRSEGQMSATIARAVARGRRSL
ncbi:MAG: phage tail tape measure protein [Bosea sp. (in: a-proteobacteria)]